MAWTSVSKPVGPTYTNINPVGKEQYDQFDITYDDSNVFYDGINPAQWSNVPKPNLGSGIMWSEAFMAWEDNNSQWGNIFAWTKVSKPV